MFCNGFTTSGNKKVKELISETTDKVGRIKRI